MYDAMCMMLCVSKYHYVSFGVMCMLACTFCQVYDAMCTQETDEGSNNTYQISIIECTLPAGSGLGVSVLATVTVRSVQFVKVYRNYARPSVAIQKPVRVFWNNS